MIDWSVKTSFALEFAGGTGEAGVGLHLNAGETNGFFWALGGFSCDATLSLVLWRGSFGVPSTVLWRTSVPNDAAFHTVELGVYSNIARAFHNGTQVYTGGNVSDQFATWSPPWRERLALYVPQTTGMHVRGKWDYIEAPWVFTDRFLGPLGERWWQGTAGTYASVCVSGDVLVESFDYGSGYGNTAGPVASVEAYRFFETLTTVQTDAGSMHRGYAVPRHPRPGYVTPYRIYEQRSGDRGQTWSEESDPLSARHPPIWTGPMLCSPTLCCDDKGARFLVYEHRSAPYSRIAAAYIYDLQGGKWVRVAADYLLPAAWYARAIGQVLVAAFQPVDRRASEGGLYLFRGTYNPSTGRFSFPSPNTPTTIVASGVREGQCSLFADERGTLFCQYVDLNENVQQVASQDWGATWA